MQKWVGAAGERWVCQSRRTSEGEVRADLLREQATLWPASRVMTLIVMNPSWLGLWLGCLSLLVAGCWQCVLLCPRANCL